MNGLTSVIKMSLRLPNRSPPDYRAGVWETTLAGVRSCRGLGTAEASGSDPRPRVCVEPRNAHADHRRTRPRRVLQRGCRGDPRAPVLRGGRGAPRGVAWTVLAAHARFGAVAVRAPACRNRSLRAAR